MKIAVVSDSHDNLEKIEKFVNLVNEENVSLVIHCGDFISPFSVKVFTEKLKCDFVGVFGNNDGEIQGILKVSGGTIAKPPAVKVVDNLKIVFMHEPLFVEQIAKSGDYDYVIYGHTHRVDVRTVGRARVLNPGELCGYLTGKSTYALIDTEEGWIEIRVVE